MNKTYSPKMFRNHPIYFILTLLLCLLGVGFIIFGIWWLVCKTERLIVSEHSVELQTGLLSKLQNEVFYKDIRNVVIYQSLLDRIFNVGSIAISTAGQDGFEIKINGIENPDAIRDYIYQQRKA